MWGNTEKQREYNRAYQRTHRERLREYKKQWAKEKRAKLISRGLTTGGKPFKPTKGSSYVRKIPKDNCQRCGIWFESPYAGDHNKIHCEDCLNEL